MTIENVRVYGLNESIVASSYPMRTQTMPQGEFEKMTDEIEKNKLNHPRTRRAIQLAQTASGSGHDNYLNGIIVQFDLTTTIKMWTQMQRYHFVEFVSSCSTMHRISQMNLSDSYGEYVLPAVVSIVEDLQDEYNRNPTEENFLKVLYNNPVGFELTARMSTNYRQLKTIYKQRQAHKLPEWNAFCVWIENLPLGKELITFG